MAGTERERYAALLRQIEAEIFSRRGEGHVNPTNERMQALVDLLGDPQRAFRGIHLSGTNGKTSTARMIDELLRGFVSPRLFEEGLICRADDRGDPVVQISPPLVAAQEEFDAIAQRLAKVLGEAGERMRVAA